MSKISNQVIKKSQFLFYVHQNILKSDLYINILRDTFSFFAYPKSELMLSKKNLIYLHTKTHYLHTEIQKKYLEYHFETQIQNEQNPKKEKKK